MHQSASAYNSGCSIVKNARAHIGANYILKLDFEEFFNSILASDIKMHVRAHLAGVLGTVDIDVIARLFCWVNNRRPPLRLCIGAPSSPFISNSIMFEFDSFIHEWCVSSEIVFTRYADDMTFSSRKPGALAGVKSKVVEVLGHISYPRLNLNQCKTVHLSRKRRMSVTGVNITPARVLSIGRSRKREIRAMYHHWLLGRLSDKQVLSLNGYLAFAEDVEPGFRRSIEGSYRRKGSGASSDA